MKNMKIVSVSLTKDQVERLCNTQPNVSAYIRNLIDSSADIDPDKYRPVPSHLERMAIPLFKNAVKHCDGVAIKETLSDFTCIKGSFVFADHEEMYFHKTYGMKPFDVVHFTVSHNAGHGEYFKHAWYCTTENSEWLDPFADQMLAYSKLPISHWKSQLAGTNMEKNEVIETLSESGVIAKAAEMIYNSDIWISPVSHRILTPNDLKPIVVDGKLTSFHDANEPRVYSVNALLHADMVKTNN